MRNFVFGDTGGHAKQLFAALRSLGAEPRTGFIPEGIRIIHLGDLIHKGPSSELIVEAVSRFIKESPNQWVQILGNHEFHHIDGAPKFWRCLCTADEIEAINEWWASGAANVTFAVESASEILLKVKPKVPLKPERGILFSHAGLTRPWWDYFKQPQSAVELSNLLNDVPIEAITKAGEMLGYPASIAAGPVWATGNNEVYNSWVGYEDSDTVVMPFTQMHGHTSSYQWSSGKWWRSDKAFRQFRDATKLDVSARAVVTTMAGGTLIGIDPGYSNRADTDIQPYLEFTT